MTEEKTQAQVLAEKLLVNKKNGWEETTEQEKQNIMKFSEGYISYLNNGKIEREIIKESEDIARSHGFKPLSSFKQLKPGDRVYYINRGKNISNISSYKKRIRVWFRFRRYFIKENK